MFLSQEICVKFCYAMFVSIGLLDNINLQKPNVP